MSLFGFNFLLIFSLAAPLEFYLQQMCLCRIRYWCRMSLVVSLNRSSQQQLLVKMFLWLGNIYEWVIRKLRERKKKLTKCGTEKHLVTPLTLKKMDASREYFKPGLFLLSLHVVFTLMMYFSGEFPVILRELQYFGGEQLVASRSVGRHTGEGSCCQSWKLFRCPGEPDRLSNLSPWKSQPDGGRDRPASGNLTTCLPVLLLSLMALLPSN